LSLVDYFLDGGGVSDGCAGGESLFNTVDQRNSWEGVGKVSRREKEKTHKKKNKAVRKSGQKSRSLRGK